jgi:hypothetical protein
MRSRSWQQSCFHWWFSLPMMKAPQRQQLLPFSTFPKIGVATFFAGLWSDPAEDPAHHESPSNRRASMWLLLHVLVFVDGKVK